MLSSTFLNMYDIKRKVITCFPAASGHDCIFNLFRTTGILEYIRKVFIIKTFKYSIRTHEQIVTRLDIVQKYDINLCWMSGPLDSPYDYISLRMTHSFFASDFPQFHQRID